MVLVCGPVVAAREAFFCCSLTLSFRALGVKNNARIYAGRLQATDIFAKSKLRNASLLHLVKQFQFYLKKLTKTILIVTGGEQLRLHAANEKSEWRGKDGFSIMKKVE